MGRSAYEGVSDGQWAVFAQKVVEERDEARAELGEALDELAFIKEEYGDGDPAEMTEDALLLKVKTITLDYNKARAEAERLRDVVRQVHAMAGTAVSGTAVGAWLVMQEIHKLTKEKP